VTAISRLLVAAFERNPVALHDLLNQTRAADWPNTPNAFLALRDELIHASDQ
jgi:hypothetical protein